MQRAEKLFVYRPFANSLEFLLCQELSGQTNRSLSIVKFYRRGVIQVLEKIIEDAQKKGMQISTLIADGKRHTFHWLSEKKKDGSYLGIQTKFGTTYYFKNWKDPSLNYSITLSSTHLSDAELLEHKKRVEEFNEAEKRKQMMRWQTAKLQCEQMWSVSEEKNHPYLISKKIKSHKTRVNPYGNLLVPGYDASGDLWAIQLIRPNGQKENIRGCKLKGSFFTFGTIDPEGEVFICEGFATAASFYEVSKKTCVAAFGAGFFIECGKELRKKYPKVKLIFSGDADPNGVGEAASKKAAKILNGYVLIPKFRSVGSGTDWNDLRTLEGEKMMAEQIVNFDVNKKSGDEKQVWIKKTLENGGFKALYDGRIEWEGKTESPKYVSNTLFLKSRSDQQTCTQALINSLLENEIRDQQKAIYEERVNFLFRTPGEDRGEQIQFLNAMLELPTEEDLAVFHHFLWQVKRKALGLSVEHHMMPVVRGKTDGGKSIAIRSLLAPLKELVVESELTACGDAREFPLFQKHLVVFMDEMAKSQNVDVAAVKRLITSDVLNYRILGTNLHHSSQNISTLIGATNNPIESLITDVTSVRRFYEFKAKDLLDWDTINKIDYVNLWRSVEASGACPLTPHMKAVKAQQETFRNKSPVEQFLEFTEAEKSTDQKVSPHILFKQFLTWSNDQGNKYHLNQTAFGIEMKRLGYLKSKKLRGIQYYLMTHNLESGAVYCQ